MSYDTAYFAVSVAMIVAFLTLAVAIVSRYPAGPSPYDYPFESEPPDMQIRGTIASFDSGTMTASVQLDGDAAQVLTGLRVNAALDPAAIAAGQRAVVDAGPGGFEELVVVAVYAA